MPNAATEDTSATTVSSSSKTRSARNASCRRSDMENNAPNRRSSRSTSSSQCGESANPDPPNADHQSGPGRKPAELYEVRRPDGRSVQRPGGYLGRHTEHRPERQSLADRPQR